ncbi:MAG: mechanosensitive ion channel, partial [Desulfurococcaceae archaeon]
MNTAELVNLLGLDWVARIVAAILAIIIAYYIGKVAGDYAKKALVKAPPEVIYNVSRATRLVFLIVGVLIALSILRIYLTGFLLAAGFAGIVIGLAAQQTLGNFFAGLTLLLEGRLRVG